MKNNINKKEILTKGWVVAFLAFICCALWGSAIPMIKIGYELFGIANSNIGSQIVFAGLRFTLAGILTIMIGSIVQKQFLVPKKEEYGNILKLCMLQTVIQYFFFYVGVAHTTGVKGSIITGTNTLIAILAASLIYHQEKLTKAKLIGCFIGFFGVFLANVNGSSMDMSFALNGEGCMFVSVTSYAFSSIYLKKYSNQSNPVMLSGYQFTVGGMILLGIGLLMGGSISHFTVAGVLILIYLAFVSAIAYSLWGILLKYNPVSKVTIYGFMNPVMGVLLSAIILGEIQQAFHLKNMVALILVAIGIYVVNRKKAENI